MSEFKVGDEVWFLIEEHGWGSTPCMIGNLNIRCETVKEVHDEFLEVTRIESIFQNYDAYRTKDEAIDAMIKRLEEMRHEK